MHFYHIALLVMALSTILISWRVPNAAAWVGIGACFYAGTAVWQNLGWPFATALGALTNYAMCRIIWKYGTIIENKRPAWEVYLYRVYILMIAIDFLYLAGAVKTQLQFAIALEIVNAYAMLIISGAGIIDRLTHHGRDFSPDYWGLLGWSHRALFKYATVYPKWWEKR